MADAEQSVMDSEFEPVVSRWFAGMAGPKRFRDGLQAGPDAARLAWDALRGFGIAEMLADIGSAAPQSGSERARLLSMLGLYAGRALYAGPLVEGCALTIAGISAAGQETRLVVPACCEDAAALPLLSAHAGANTLSGHSSAVPYAAIADGFLVAARRGDEIVLAHLDGKATGLRMTPVVQADGTDVALLHFDHCAVSAAAATNAVRNLAQLLLLSTAARLIGAAEKAAEITREYLKTRKQFGRELAAFQALQHRAVDHYIEIQLARALLAGVVNNWDTELDRQALLHALKAFAAQTALTVTKGAIQLHGGIGFTHDCDAGLYLRHAMTLAARYGNAASHRRRFAQAEPGLFE